MHSSVIQELHWPHLHRGQGRCCTWKQSSDPSVSTGEGPWLSCTGPTFWFLKYYSEARQEKLRLHHPTLTSPEPQAGAQVIKMPPLKHLETLSAMAPVQAAPTPPGHVVR